MRNTRRSTSSSSQLPSTWIGWKELGKRAYDAGDYEEALHCYTTATQIEYECPAMERQVLLSNIVACRLKLVATTTTGSTDNATAAAQQQQQAAAAVENAKQCIAINPSWAKGHVRLASAYIALGSSLNTAAATANNNNNNRRSYSNDACNALQTALRLDPGNPVARQMLMRELRRDHHSAPAAAAAAASSSSSFSSRPPPPPPPPPPPQNPNYIPPPQNPHYIPPPGGGGGGSTTSSTTRGAADNNNNNNNNRNHANTNMDVDDNHDDSMLSWRERFQYHQARLIHWYTNQTDVKKSCIKVCVVFLVLYLAFGGRFGLETSSSSSSGSRQSLYSYDNHAATTTTTTAGNYGSDNAYEEYRRRRAQGSSQYESDGYDYYSDMHRQRQQQQHHYGGGGRSSSSSWSSSLHFPNLFDGSLPSMAILLGIGYMCHRHGINPFQVIMMLNIMAGRGRHHGRGGGGVYYGGGGGGMGGFGRRFGGRYGGGGGGGGRQRYW